MGAGEGSAGPSTVAWTGVVAAGALRGHGSDRRCGGGVHTVRDGSAVEMEVSERAGSS